MTTAIILWAIFACQPVSGIAMVCAEHPVDNRRWSSIEMCDLAMKADKRRSPPFMCAHVMNNHTFK